MRDVKIWFWIMLAVYVIAAILGSGCNVPNSPSNFPDVGPPVQPVASSGVGSTPPPSVENPSSTDTSLSKGAFAGPGITSFGDGKVSGKVALHSGGADRWAGLAVFEFVTAGGRHQRLIALKDHEVPVDGFRQFAIRIDWECGRAYQADFVHEEPPEEIFDGVVPHLITPLVTTGAKWRAPKCPPPPVVVVQEACICHIQIDENQQPAREVTECEELEGHENHRFDYAGECDGRSF